MESGRWPSRIDDVYHTGCGRSLVSAGPLCAAASHGLAPGPGASAAGPSVLVDVKLPGCLEHAGQGGKDPAVHQKVGVAHVGLVLGPFRG